MDKARLEKLKFDYLGYKTTMTPPWRLIENISLLSLCCDRVYDNISQTAIESSDIKTIDDVRKKAKAFYDKHFELHDVYLIDTEEYQAIAENFADNWLHRKGDDLGKPKLEDNDVFIEKMKKVSPYDIPIVLIEGAKNMEGITTKIIPISLNATQEQVEKRIPFVFIKIPETPNQMSATTYVHELAHTQLDSHPGYTDDFIYAEVIPAFLERVYAYEEGIDILEAISKVRLCNNLWDLADDCSKRLREPGSTAIYHELGLLLGLKLFDSYFHERKEKEKKKYLEDVQKIMNGSYKVEQMLAKRGITLNAALSRDFIKGYLA